MANRNVILGGADNGNGTFTYSARSCHSIHEGLYPAVYGFGNKARHMNREANLSAKINSSTNGGFEGSRYVDTDNGKDLISDDFEIIRDGITYGIGQTSFLYEHQIKGLGEDRYHDYEFMTNMINGFFTSLVRTGTFCDDENDVYLCVGMPPKWFYHDTARQTQFRECYDDVLYQDGPFEVDGKAFYVQKHIVISEALSGYFDWLRGDDLKAITGRSSKDGALLIDVGQGTFDTAILRDLELGQERVETNIDLGIHTLFELLADQMNLDDVSVTDIEAFYYNRNTRISRLEEMYNIKMPIAKQLYFNMVRNHLRQHYAKKVNRIDMTLIMGGVLEVCDPDEVSKNFNIASKPIFPLDVMSNSRGYRKTIEAWAYKNNIYKAG